MGIERDPNRLLASAVTARARAAGLAWDTYDADFLIGVVTNWLEQNDAILTPTGVQPYLWDRPNPYNDDD